MTFRKRLFFIALGMSCMAVLPARAATLFNEDFESEAYPLDLPLPVDYGVIAHGRWNRVPPESTPGIVVEEDGSRVLQLKSLPGFTRGTRAIATLGSTNQEETVTTEALRLRFRFKFTAPLGETFFFQLLGSDGRSKGMITMDEGGALHASFGGEREPVGGVLGSDRWYTVEMLLPANPRTKTQYEVNVYEGETQIGHGKGVMARSMEPEGANYRSIDIQHKRVNEALLIDDLVVETLSGGEAATVP